MNVINFGAKPCERVRRYLDSYIRNELLIETNHEVLKHLETCKECSEEVGARTRMRTILQRAARNEQVPPDLQARIRTSLSNRSAHSRFTGGLAAWTLAAAATFLVVLGGWGGLHLYRAREMAQVVAQTDSILNIGGAHHIHCSVDAKFSQNNFTLEETIQRLGPEFSGLAAVAQEKVPGGYQVVAGHICHLRDREYIHLALRNQGKLVSITLTRKRGESFPKSTLVSVIQAAGTSIYQGRLRNYEVAGFETRYFLGFVTSNTPRDENLWIAESVVPSIQSFIAKLEG